MWLISGLVCKKPIDCRRSSCDIVTTLGSAEFTLSTGKGIGFFENDDGIGCLIEEGLEWLGIFILNTSSTARFSEECIGWWWMSDCDDVIGILLVDIVAWSLWC